MMEKRTTTAAMEITTGNARKKAKARGPRPSKKKEHANVNADDQEPIPESQIGDHSTEKNTANSDTEQAKPDPEPLKPKFQVVEHEGDIFDAPDNAVLIHACNCIGSWGGGIAVAFKERYPEAYLLYHRHCKDSTPTALIGTALLIPPSEEDGPKHYVGCLFTSRKFGMGRDPPNQILRNTRPAMEDLIEQIAQTVQDGGSISEIRICHVNSGLFRVPWERSKAVIEKLEVSDDIDLHEITAWIPAKNEPDDSKS